MNRSLGQGSEELARIEIGAAPVRPDAVGGPQQEDRQRLGVVLGRVNRSEQPDAVAHGDAVFGLGVVLLEPATVGFLGADGREVRGSPDDQAEDQPDDSRGPQVGGSIRAPVRDGIEGGDRGGKRRGGKPRVHGADGRIASRSPSTLAEEALELGVQIAHGGIQFDAGLDQFVEHGEAAGQALADEFLLPGRLGPLVGEEERHCRRAAVEGGARVAFAQLQRDVQGPRLQFQAPGLPARATAVEPGQPFEGYHDVASGLSGVWICGEESFADLETALVVAQGEVGVAWLAPTGEEVGELVQTDRDVASGLSGVWIGGEESFADLETALVVAQGEVGVAWLAPPGEEVGQSFETDRDVASGLSGVWICGEESFENLMAALVVAQGEVGVAWLAPTGEEVGELVQTDRDVASSLSGVWIGGEESFADLETALVVAQGEVGVAWLAPTGEEVGELVQTDRDVASGLSGVWIGGEESFADLETALVVAQGEVGVAWLAPPGEEVGQSFETDRDVARGLSGVWIGGEESFENLMAALVVAQGEVGVAWLAPTGEEVGQSFETDRDVTSGLSGVWIGGEESFADLETALVVAQGEVGVAWLAPTGEEVGQSFETDRDVASGLSGVWICGEESFADLETALVVAQGEVGVAWLAPPGEEVGQSFKTDRDVASGLSGVWIGGEESFADLETALVVAQGEVGVAGLAPPGEEVGQAFEHGRDVVSGLSGVWVGGEQGLLHRQDANCEVQGSRQGTVGSFEGCSNPRGGQQGGGGWVGSDEVVELVPQPAVLRAQRRILRLLHVLLEEGGERVEEPVQIRQVTRAVRVGRGDVLGDEAVDAGDGGHAFEAAVVHFDFAGRMEEAQAAQLAPDGRPPGRRAGGVREYVAVALAGEGFQPRQRDFVGHQQAGELEGGAGGRAQAGQGPADERGDVVLRDLGAMADLLCTAASPARVSTGRTRPSRARRGRYSEGW
jgi:hypothetical protein